MTKKGFTLIELLAVIVVLAILALVVTPIVLNIVENAQSGADERSLEAYAKVLQSTYYEMKMKDTSLDLQDYLNKSDTEYKDSLTYNGSKVICERKEVSENVSGTQTIKLYNCTVDGRGYYNFINGKAEKVVSNSNNENTDEQSPVEDLYAEGKEVFYDVVSGSIDCNNYHSDNSITGYNGINGTGNQTSCLKFYSIRRYGGNVSLLLDHNTSTSAWSDGEDVRSGPNVAIQSLREDTKDWNVSIKYQSYSGTVSTEVYTNGGYVTVSSTYPVQYENSNAYLPDIYEDLSIYVDSPFWTVEGDEPFGSCINCHSSRAYEITNSGPVTKYIKYTSGIRPVIKVEVK